MVWTIVITSTEQAAGRKGVWVGVGVRGQLLGWIGAQRGVTRGSLTVQVVWRALLAVPYQVRGRQGLMGVRVWAVVLTQVHV